VYHLWLHINLENAKLQQENPAWYWYEREEGIQYCLAEWAMQIKKWVLQTLEDDKLIDKMKCSHILVLKYEINHYTVMSMNDQNKNTLWSSTFKAVPARVGLWGDEFALLLMDCFQRWVGDKGVPCSTAFPKNKLLLWIIQ